jgi:hypothetical protein
VVLGYEQNRVFTPQLFLREGSHFLREGSMLKPLGWHAEILSNQMPKHQNDIKVITLGKRSSRNDGDIDAKHITSHHSPSGATTRPFTSV